MVKFAISKTPTSRESFIPTAPPPVYKRLDASPKLKHIRLPETNELSSAGPSFYPQSQDGRNSNHSYRRSHLKDTSRYLTQEVSFTGSSRNFYSIPAMSSSVFFAERKSGTTDNHPEDNDIVPFYARRIQDENDHVDGSNSPGGATCGSCFGSRSSKGSFASVKTPRHGKARLPFIPFVASTASPSSIPRLCRSYSKTHTSSPNTPTSYYTPQNFYRAFARRPVFFPHSPINQTSSLFNNTNTPQLPSFFPSPDASFDSSYEVPGAPTPLQPSLSQPPLSLPSQFLPESHVSTRVSTFPPYPSLSLSSLPSSAPPLPPSCLSFPVTPNFTHPSFSSSIPSSAIPPLPCSRKSLNLLAVPSDSSRLACRQYPIVSDIPADTTASFEPTEVPPDDTAVNSLPPVVSCEEEELVTAPAEVTESSFDLQFDGIQVKLYRKLSAKCHCQFDVWEAEATAYVGYEMGVCSANDVLNEHYRDTVFGKRGLVETHKAFHSLGGRFALKLLEVDGCEPSKLKYKTHSVITEGRQLNDLCQQMWCADTQTYLFGEEHKVTTTNEYSKLPPSASPSTSASSSPSASNNTSPTPTISTDASTEASSASQPLPNTDGILLLRSSACRPYKTPSNLMPIPRYLWTAGGVRRNDGRRVLGVAMEMIRGRSLTHLLQQLRCPMKPSSALLALEISVKIVESQRVLAEKLHRPLINWDTKPGNIILELSRSSSGRLHCRRAVIVDLGDALPGPSFWFPTRHRQGDTPGYIICTKGYCSPECALLVFLLASSSRCASFRKVWYSDKTTIEQLQQTRKLRIPHRWRQWVKQGYLRRTTAPTPPASTTDTSDIHKDNLLPLPQQPTRPAPPPNLPSLSPQTLLPFSVSPLTSSMGPSDISNQRLPPLPSIGSSEQRDSGKDRGCWEILFSEKSVVFSTGLVLAQLFGGPNLLQVVGKDEVRALDLLCEWGFKDTNNLFSDLPNLCPTDLLPTTGVFAEDKWRSRLLILLEGCLAFLPMERWSFRQIGEYLNRLYQDYFASYQQAKIKALQAAGDE